MLSRKIMKEQLNNLVIDLIEPNQYFTIKSVSDTIKELDRD